LIDQQRASGNLTHFAPIASTGGLVDLVCDLIGELKRLEIWPEDFQRACDARGMTAKDRELLDLYEAYQQRLQEHHLYDAEGRFWSARDWLKKTWSAPDAVPAGQLPWAKLRLVAADGFTDFTRTQHEILEILGSRVEEILISLPLEGATAGKGGGARGELFAKPLKTLAQLGRRHFGMTVEEMPRQATVWPAMAHLEATLFGNPRHARAADDTTGLEVLAAASSLGEIQLIAGRIKRLLVEGDPLAHGQTVRPGEIAVVFRRPQEVGNLVGEVFAELGIPLSLETGQPLGRAPALAALVALLRLDIDDWPLQSLLAVLGSNYFCPNWPQWLDGRALAATDGAIRHLQIPQGRRHLLRRLQGDAVHRDVGWVERSEPHQGVLEDMVGLAAGPLAGPLDPPYGLLAQLAAVLDALPEQATLAAWGKAWQRLAEQTGLLQTAAAPMPDAAPSRISDRAAWDCLQESLRESDLLARWLQCEAPVLDRRAALAALLDILDSQQLKPPGDDAGRVRVLSAASVRGLKVPYLFLAGLCEKAFPAPEREDRLYSEADYQRLIEQGLPLVARTERNSEEMLLFYEAATRATRRLWLSYPALNDSAQPLSPSPYLKEVEQACGQGRIARTEFTDLSPVPAGDDPLSMAEFRVKAVAKALGGDVALLAGLLANANTPPAAATGVGDNVLSGLLLHGLRQDRSRFGPAEGMISGRSTLRQLESDYAPARIFSATELEQYAFCPYRYFLAKVLKAKPLEELALEVDYLERGRLAHAVMAAFHQRVNASCGGPTSPATLPEEEYQRLVGETLEEVLGIDVPQKGTVPFSSDENPDSPQDAMREIDRRLLARWLADYRQQHQRYDALWQTCEIPLRPEFFEVSFGQSSHAGGPPSTKEPMELYDKDQTIRIGGRIDRIDTGRVAGEIVFNVVDYKTGGSTKFSVEAVARGLTLQLPLYALAVGDVVLSDRDCVPWQAGYWRLADNGFSPKQALKMYCIAGGALEPDPQWETVRALLTTTVAALVRGMREGQFPVWSSDVHCTGFCEYATVCRINQIRSLEKTWLPPGDNN
jgi:superfamily I DNA/RNA helicase/RecB family exonuclease